MEPPSEFLCPVSFEVMRRPVRLVETGKVYDEASITDWFALGKNTCPSTGQTLKSLEYESENELKRRIDKWIGDTGYTEEEETSLPSVNVSRAKVRKLMHAAKHGLLDNLRELQRNGFLLSVVDERYHDFTALHYAAQFGHKDVMEFLISHDVDKDQKDTMGLTPLHIAAYYGMLEAVKLLLRRGANPNLQDKAGSTPLHLSARKGNKPIIIALLNSDADKGIKDYGGDTARDKAGLWGRLLIRRMLK